ncbi:MAG: tandem-95 repeat protein [Nitrosomonadales bacterium]|nr:tandem-95 repeat protein [Nitrosomonadales bacterium]
MFTMDVPYVPAYDTPIVLVQAAAGSAPPPASFILNECQEIDHQKGPTSAFHVVDPAGLLQVYFASVGSKVDLADIKVTLLQGTQHGSLSSGVDSLGFTSYYYDPVPGYLGDDQAKFMTDTVYEGTHFRIMIIVQIKVLETVNERAPECPDPVMIKAPKPATGDSGYSAGYNLASVSVNFADLPNGAVGQAVGNTITLDTNAAGHNWFIDTTPWDNSEYLPTSNPYEWVAKEGSAAYGKMDMLSVLLHEYGHALGIEHSADGHDYMATTLTPGVRRMPSAEELALMQQLVAQAKGEMVATSDPFALSLSKGLSWFDKLTTNGSNDAPNPMPLPIPLGAGFGMAFIGRMRRSSYGGMSPSAELRTGIDVVGAPTITQYAVAANATFANLSSTAGWNSQGSVDIASGTATLSEVSASQTRLSQVFMLHDKDRYLSFTLSGTALDNLTGAPDDAFEVALLDANTGANLLGGIGMTRTDAFLNLQGDGTEHAASSVTRIDNPDGSRTYRVDLTGVAKNTAVNLSFDLLGFGKDNSHVTLSDIRVSGLPQLHDDVATLPEDNLLTFDPFAQADAALRPMLASSVVSAPTHGAITVNADGTFSYTPDLDYFGTDSFTYRLSDGPLDSNLAAVSLTVTAVNDAPVAADVALGTAEDNALVIALGSPLPNPLPPAGEGANGAPGAAQTLYATDVDSATLTTQIVTGPTHGVLVANADGSYSYTPDANYFGADSFTYRVNDGALDSNIATVSLAIAAVNDAPLGANNFSAVTIGSLPLAGVLTHNGVFVIAGQSIGAADIAAGDVRWEKIPRRSTRNDYLCRCCWLGEMKTGIGCSAMLPGLMAGVAANYH